MRIKWNKKWLWLGIFLLFFCGFTGIFTSVQLSMNMKFYNLEILPFNDGWAYEKDNEQKAMVLPKNVPLSVNEEITIINRIPLYNVPQITMALLNNCQNIKVYIDEKEVFVNSSKRLDSNNKKPGVQWEFITLPLDSQAKEIRIQFSCEYRMYAGKLPSIMLGEKGTLLLYHFIYAFPNVLMDYLLIILGFVLLILALYWEIKGRNGKTYLTWGIFIILFALWARTINSGMEILFLTHRQSLFLSLICWMLLPISYILFIKADIFPGNNKFNLFLNLFILNCAAVLILQYTGLADIVQTVGITHILMVFLLSYMYYCFIREIWIKKIRKIRVNEIGFIIMTICILLEFFMMYTKVTKLQMGCVIRVGVLVYTFCLGMNEIIRNEEKERNLLMKENQEKEAELQMFLSQLHPHFIFNALGVIRIMTRTDPEKAYGLVYDFSKCLRASIHSIEKNEPITFAEEARHLKAYTNIEEVRFASRVEAKYDIKADDFLIPALTVQPLVENAIRHGLRKGETKGYVYVRSFEDKNAYIIEVEDNGIGFDIVNYNNKPHRETKLLGIENIRFRLKNFGGELNIISPVLNSLDGKGTKVVLIFPKDKNGALGGKR